MSSVAVLEAFEPGTLRLWPPDEPERSPAPDAAAADATLEAAVASTWGALEAGFTAPCLLCGGAVHPRWSAGAGVVGGRCEACGTELD